MDDQTMIYAATMEDLGTIALQGQLMITLGTLLVNLPPSTHLIDEDELSVAVDDLADAARATLATNQYGVPSQIGLIPLGIGVILDDVEPEIEIEYFYIHDQRQGIFCRVPVFEGGWVPIDDVLSALEISDEDEIARAFSHPRAVRMMMPRHAPPRPKQQRLFDPQDGYVVDVPAEFDEPIFLEDEPLPVPPIDDDLNPRGASVRPGKLF